jgi:HAD superfamily hydrolase (TIGR01549 family)
MRYRLVCLDAGFTLLQPRTNMAQRLSALLRRHGHEPTEEELHRAWEIADRWFWDDYHRPDNDTWASDERIEATWRSYHSLMLRELGVDAGEHELIDAILAAQWSADTWQLYDDVEPALEALRPDGRAPTIAIISDWGSRLSDITSGLGLDRWIDFVLASGEVGIAKPSPEFFLMACERAGVTAGEAVMVGDSLRADVEGARAAGMTGVLLDREGRPDARRAEAAADVPVIRSLSELPPMVLGQD